MRPPRRSPRFDEPAHRYSGEVVQHVIEHVGGGGLMNHVGVDGNPVLHS